MKKSEKQQTITFSSTEKNLLIELASTAPAALLSLQKLIKGGSPEMYFKESPRINLLLFLLTEFTKRSVLEPENEAVKIDIPETDL